MKNDMDTSKLKAFNTYGGFNKNGDEYHILNTNTPLPWCNVIANERFGTIISSYGTVYTYFKNSREYKITNWCNDWISFTPGEKFEGIFDKDYNLVYGFGYATVLEDEEYIEKKLDIFVPVNDDIKIQLIEIKNNNSDEKKVKIKYSLDLALGVAKETNANFILSKCENGYLKFKNPYTQEFNDIESFLTVLLDEDLTIIYDAKNYSVSIEATVKANSKKTFAIVLGAYDSSKSNYIEEVREKFNTEEKIYAEYEATKKYWREKVVRHFKTGSEYLDIMANGWLLYQTIVCRLFAKSGFYQSGGAIGFRDQLQDSMALISTWPEKTRSQIILHSSKQFEKGDVLHWWHEHNNAGIRTYFSDDYLWLPYVLSEYVEKTKDTSILDVKTPYLEDKPMGDNRELYDRFENIDVKDSVYNHAKKAIMYSLSRIDEKNGLLDIGDGDWNDGFSDIRGQSVWLTFFMMDILKRFEKLADIVLDKDMIDVCKKYRHLFKHSIVEHTWDSDHFVRAFFANGDVLGANSNVECKIDLITQAWAVISMKDYKDLKDELELSLKTADKYLVDREHMLVRLLYPAFDKPKNNPGYIKAYVPGIRENGGQYTHGATWLAKAYFELGKDKEAMEILNMLTPIIHSDTKEKANIYMVEPYVIAADVYSNPEHMGRGGWTWYTGSSAWLYKIIEDYLGKK